MADNKMNAVDVEELVEKNAVPHSSMTEAIPETEEEATELVGKAADTVKLALTPTAAGSTEVTERGDEKEEEEENDEAISPFLLIEEEEVVPVMLEKEEPVVKTISSTTTVVIPTRISPVSQEPEKIKEDKVHEPKKVLATATGPVIKAEEKAEADTIPVVEKIDDIEHEEEEEAEVLGIITTTTTPAEEINTVVPQQQQQQANPYQQPQANPYYYYKEPEAGAATTKAPQPLSSSYAYYLHQQQQEIEKIKATAKPSTGGWTMYQDPETGYPYWQ